MEFKKFSYVIICLQEERQRKYEEKQAKGVAAEVCVKFYVCYIKIIGFCWYSKYI